MAIILTVDDSPVNRRFLCTLLSAHGHEVREAKDGGDVLAMVRASRPDLIISDVLMPVVDGYQLLRQLREDPTTSRIPVVFYTAHTGARAMALASGAAWFLSNVDSAEILQVIERVLAGETEDPSGHRGPPAVGRMEARAKSES
jgi:two-component system cell cycle sensor histidine kinase/response regulator CckA